MITIYLYRLPQNVLGFKQNLISNRESIKLYQTYFKTISGIFLGTIKAWAGDVRGWLISLVSTRISVTQH